MTHKETMNILYPHNIDLEHKVYKRTFLQSVQVNYNFNLQEDKLTNSEKTNSFFPEYFGIDASGIPWPVSQIELTNQESGVKYVFGKNHIELSVGHNIYKSFLDTLIPFIIKMDAYINNVCEISQLDSISIAKSNVWNVCADQGIEDVLNAALQYTFKEGHLNDFTFTRGTIGSFPYKKSKEENVNLGDATLKIILSVEVSDKKSAKLRLDFIAKASNILVPNTIETTKLLNEAIYYAYHDFASDNVISLMKEEGEKS
jgi:hypothetical protein